MSEGVRELVDAYLRARRWQERRWYNPKALPRPTRYEQLVIERDEAGIPVRIWP